MGSTEMETVRNFASTLRDMSAELYKIARSTHNTKEAQEQTEQEDKVTFDPFRNRILGYDKKFCLANEVMLKVGTGDIVVVGEPHGDDLVATFDFVDNKFLSAYPASWLTHNVNDCWNLLIKDAGMSVSEYRNRTHLKRLSTEKSWPVAVRRNLVERARHIAVSMIRCSYADVNPTNTCVMDTYKKFNEKNLVCPKCGGSATICKETDDDYYFQCWDCNCEHWFGVYDYFDPYYYVPGEMRKWDEEVNGRYEGDESSYPAF